MKEDLRTHRETGHELAAESRSVQHVKDRLVVCSGGTRPAYVAAAKRPRFCDSVSNLDPSDLKYSKGQIIPDPPSTQTSGDFDSSPKSTAHCPTISADFGVSSYAPLDPRRSTEVQPGFAKVSQSNSSL